MKYNTLKDAIPRTWREILQKMKIPDDAISFKESIAIQVNKRPKDISLLTNKDVYWILVKNKQKTPIIMEKPWNDLEFTNDQWKDIFTIPGIIRNTKIKAFQYKTLYNLLPCNLYLNKIKKNDTDKCDLCNMVDDIPHFLLECAQVKAFWNRFRLWWNNWTGDNIQINRQNILAGILGKKQNILNACIFLGKWHIYKTKLNQSAVFFYKFLCDLKYYLSVEKTIALRNNKLTAYDTMWKELEETLT